MCNGHMQWGSHVEIQNSINISCLNSSLLECSLWWHWSSIGLEIRPQSAFSAFGALLPSANYSAEWSGWVWQPSADSNGRLAHHYYQQRAVTPDPESLNSYKTGAKLSLLSAEGCHIPLDGRHCPLITYQGVFFKGGENLLWYKKPFTFDE